MARRGSGRGGGRPDVSQMPEDIANAAINALREAAKEVINDLAEISPNWSGDFRESWYVETAEGRRGVKPTGEGGRYNLFNIPLLKVQGRDKRGRFTSGVPANIGKLELFIGNSSPYAQEAMDLIPGVFIYPGFEPAGEEQPRGGRQGNIRGDLQGRGSNRSTAPLHWYSTYMEGGAFGAAFQKGAKAGFIAPINRPR